MKSPDRYHHGNLAAALLQSAYEIAQAHGPSAITLRELARRNSVTVSAVYRHFANQNALLKELKLRIAVELATELRTALSNSTTNDASDVSRALEKIKTICRTYIMYAQTNPGLFRTASSYDAALSMTLENMQQNEPFQLFSSVFEPLVELGYVQPGQQEMAKLSLWSMVHGAATLLLDSPMARLSDTEQRAFADHAINVALRGIRQTT